MRLTLTSWPGISCSFLSVSSALCSTFHQRTSLPGRRVSIKRKGCQGALHVASPQPLTSFSLLFPTPRNTKHQDTGKMRRRRKRKKTSAPAAATQMPATRRRRWREGWAGADKGRAEPGKPSWSGMTPPSPTSAPPSVPAHCPFCKPQLMYVSLSLSPPISMTLWAGLPQPPGTRHSCAGTPVGWFQEAQPHPQWGLRGGLSCHAHCSCP